MMRFLILWTVLIAAPAGAQMPAKSPPPAGDLAAMMRVYADGIAGLRTLSDACAPGRMTDWADGEALLLGSLGPAGLTDSDLADIRERLGRAGPAPDCAGAQAKFRMEATIPGRWRKVHASMLGAIKIPVIEPEAISAAAKRLEAIRLVLADHMDAQRAMLHCMSVIDPRSLPAAWTDWDHMIEQVYADMVGAGIKQLEALSFTLPARSRELMSALNGDTATLMDGCIADRAWLDRLYSFGWYTVRGDVEKVLAPAQP